MKNRIIGIILFVIFISKVNCQELKKSNYYIITCEKIGVYKNDTGPRVYNWIVSADSINYQNGFNKYPLYLEGFSKNHRFQCANKKLIDVFTTTIADNYDLSEQENIDVKNIKNIINTQKKFFFTNSKKWKNGITEKMNFSVTPVSGNFCSSKISKESGKQIQYYGIIYLALSNFKYEPDLLNSKSYDIIIKSDFGNFDVRNE